MGYNNVEIIVDEVLHEESHCLIFGIRDCDYTRYNKNYTCPQNIFLTDHRDIEMMMFNAPSVINSLKVWNPKFPEKIEGNANVCRYLGYLRIYNDVFNIGCTFHDNIKVSDVLSMKDHSLIQDWDDVLLSKFLSNCNGAVNKEDINTFIATNKLDDESFLNICRGHDVINLLQYMMVKKEYSKNNIVVCMINSYSFEDFEKTNLCQKINNWSIGKGVNVLFCKDG
ncbi:MAG: hypothetical protein LUC24_06105 [Bacteroidales bacterium]|nr:hypothetical protein [Bacteroidales bacterium]